MPISYKSRTPAPPPANFKLKMNNKKYLIVLGVTLLVVASCAGGWWFMKKRASGNISDDEYDYDDEEILGQRQNGMSENPGRGQIEPDW